MPYSDRCTALRLVIREYATSIDLELMPVQRRPLQSNGYGACDVRDISSTATASTIRSCAPELLAGKRMDLNRPFGDGRDSGDGFDNDGDGQLRRSGR